MHSSNRSSSQLSSTNMVSNRCTCALFDCNHKHICQAWNCSNKPGLTMNSIMGYLCGQRKDETPAFKPTTILKIPCDGCIKEMERYRAYQEIRNDGFEEVSIFLTNPGAFVRRLHRRVPLSSYEGVPIVQSMSNGKNRTNEEAFYPIDIETLHNREENSTPIFRPYINLPSPYSTSQTTLERVEIAMAAPVELDIARAQRPLDTNLTPPNSAIAPIRVEIIHDADSETPVSHIPHPRKALLDRLEARVQPGPQRLTKPNTESFEDITHVLAPLEEGEEN